MSASYVHDYAFLKSSLLTFFHFLDWGCLSVFSTRISLVTWSDRMADIVTRVFWGKKSIGKFGHRFKVFPHLLHDTDVMLHILVCFWLRKHLEILYVDPCQVTISGFSSMLEAASFFFFFLFFPGLFQL